MPDARLIALLAVQSVTVPCAGDRLRGPADGTWVGNAYRLGNSGHRPDAADAHPDLSRI